jgi:O-ureido-D-serine cyclo-ligase
MPVALVTAAAARGRDDDLVPLVGALVDVGVSAEVVDWHDDAVDWAGYDLAVVRSPWDYTDHHDAFLSWAERVAAATTLLNPENVLRWNTDKRYLADLELLGVPIVPTMFLAPGEPLALPDAAAFVVKPTVSAGARDTDRYDAADAAHRANAEGHVARLHAAGRTVMVQPYVDTVDARGESALVHIDGVLSHTLRKGAILAAEPEWVDGLYAAEDMAARDATPAERVVAAETIEAAARHLRLDAQLLYARVDLVDGPDGRPWLLELELTEPSLFLAFAPGALERFAAAIAARL